MGLGLGFVAIRAHNGWEEEVKSEKRVRGSSIPSRGGGDAEKN